MTREVFKRAFLNGLLRDALEVEPPPSGDLKAAVQGEPYGGPDKRAFISAARALGVTGKLWRKPTLRLARELLELGFAAEALALLSRRDEKVPSFEWLFQTARAWLALGAAKPAREALDQAVAAVGDEDQVARAKALGEHAALSLGGVGPQSWAEAQRLVAAAQELGLYDSAALALRRHLAGPAAGSDPDGAVEVAFGLLRVLAPGPAAELLGAMGDLYDAAGQGREWRRALAAMRGAPTDDLASAPLAGGETDRLQTCLAQAYAAAGLWRDAAARFVPGPDHADMLAENLCELARCIGRDVLSDVDLGLRRRAGRKVFDLFPFNGEFAVLELKLAEMSPWVDGFVIIEAAETFTGKPKPLHFAERSQDFAAYADKIIHVPIGAFPGHLTTAWAREFFQRDSGVLGLVGRCAPDDVVIISDVDEVLRPEAIQDLPALAVGAALRVFQYFLNYELVGKGPAVKTVLTTAGLLAGHGCSYLRTAIPRHAARPYAANAGWHFTSVGSAEAIAHKYQSFSHTEWGHLDRNHFAARLEKIRSGGLGDGYVRRGLDEDLPETLRLRPELFADCLL